MLMAEDLPSVEFGRLWFARGATYVFLYSPLKKMHCIKLLGDKLMARSFPSQVNEIHARVAVLNRFTELGRPLTQITP